MESSSIVQELPFKNTPRPGQAEVLEVIAGSGISHIAIKLPTGYGKTFTAYAAYHLLKRMKRCDRMLIVVPTDKQLMQLVDNSKRDYDGAGLKGLRQVVDLRFFGTQALKQHHDSTHEVYAITIQSLIASRGNDLVGSLTKRGDWMVVFDEYHHYGNGTWGEVAKLVPYAFRLAMSATPNRKKGDGIFGEPSVTVEYRTAAREGAVKELHGHAYNYRVDALDADDNPLSFTTAELFNEAGGDGDAIEKLRITRKLRWSPKYISPLVIHPLERMISERTRTGKNLRAIIGGMCVSHAEMVCKQVRQMFPSLTVEWVGTGIDGRSDVENTDIIKRFLCPDRGSIDVLVHVGMAGEGLDSTLVSEVVHLNKASLNNTKNQEAGRAARALKSADGEPIIGHINYDSSSDYAEYTGTKIMDAMDFNAPQDDEESQERDVEDKEYKELPDEPAIELANVELLGIDHGDDRVKFMAQLMHKHTTAGERYDVDDPAFLDLALLKTKEMLRVEAASFDEQSELAQRADAIKSALSTVTGLVIRCVFGANGIVERSFAGDIQKRINTRKKKAIGAINTADMENLKRHYAWLKNLEQDILTNGLPGWLA